MEITLEFDLRQLSRNLNIQATTRLILFNSENLRNGKVVMLLKTNVLTCNLISGILL